MSARRRRRRGKSPPPRCPHCDRPVLRAVWERREVLLDPDPAPAAIAGFLAHKSASGAWVARVITGGHRHPLERTYAVHATTCPHRPEDARTP